MKRICIIVRRTAKAQAIDSSMIHFGFRCLIRGKRP
jgi:hypothetical protein